MSTITRIVDATKSAWFGWGNSYFPVAVGDTVLIRTGTLGSVEVRVITIEEREGSYFVTEIANNKDMKPKTFKISGFQIIQKVYKNSDYQL